MFGGLRRNKRRVTQVVHNSEGFNERFHLVEMPGLN